jgi:hypothetical protein
MTSFLVPHWLLSLTKYCILCNFSLAVESLKFKAISLLCLIAYHVTTQPETEFSFRIALDMHVLVSTSVSLPFVQWLPH